MNWQYAIYYLFILLSVNIHRFRCRNTIFWEWGAAPECNKSTRDAVHANSFLQSENVWIQKPHWLERFGRDPDLPQQTPVLPSFVSLPTLIGARAADLSWRKTHHCVDWAILRIPTLTPRGGVGAFGAIVNFQDPFTQASAMNLSFCVWCSDISRDAKLEGLLLSGQFL